MQKILIITDNLKDQINGVVTTFKNIEKHAIKNNYLVDFITPADFFYFDTLGYPEVKISIPWNIGNKIKQSNPNFIHIATEGPIGLAARIFCDRHSWKYNTSYHTKFPEFLEKIYKIPANITYRYVRWFHKHSGRVLTTTTTMVNDLKAHGFNGDIIPWTRGVDRSIFSSELRNKRTDRNPVLLSVGRISKEKGIDDFCQLDYPGAIKYVVGDGPYLAELRRKYPDINFVGAKTGTALAEYYANADVFVFTSRVDTFGVVIIESLAVGTPVAAYQVPGPIDILDQGVTGYMGENLKENVRICLNLDREAVELISQKWSWKSCWEIFRDNLIPVHQVD